MRSRTSHWLALGLLGLAVCYLVFRAKETEMGTGSREGRPPATNVPPHEAEGRDSQDPKATKRDRAPITPRAQSNNQPQVEWIDDPGGLSEAVLESQGLNQTQIDAAKEVYREIADAISGNFVKNCKEEVIHDGSFTHVLKISMKAVAKPSSVRSRKRNENVGWNGDMPLAPASPVPGGFFRQGEGGGSSWIFVPLAGKCC